MNNLNIMVIFMGIEVVGIICGSIFADIHADKLGNFKQLNKRAAMIASLIPFINLLVIYAVIKYLLTGKE